MMFSHESRRTIVLGVCALLLGGYTYFTAPQQQRLSGQAQQEKSERLVFPVNPEKITQLEVAFDGQHLAGKRTPEGWKQEQSGTPLPSVAVDDFLTTLTKLVDLGEVEGKPDELSEYGLKPPKTQITIHVEGSAPQTLTLGKHNPVNTSLYALVNGSQNVILVGSIISWDLRKLMDAAKSIDAGQQTQS